MKPVIEQSVDVNVNWYQWGAIEIVKDDNVIDCISCIPKEAKFLDFVNEMKKDVNIYPEHSFGASWQQKQMASCIANLRPGCVALVMDFSENYGCLFQSEVQSGFFDRNQVTIHPMMTCHKKREHLESDDDEREILVKHAIIGYY